MGLLTHDTDQGIEDSWLKAYFTYEATDPAVKTIKYDGSEDTPEFKTTTEGTSIITVVEAQQ